jgi:hypothetical protein
MPTSTRARRAVAIRSICSLLLHTRRVDEVVRFYKAIGVEMGRKFTHDGLLHVQGNVPGLQQFWILQGDPGKAPKPHGAGSTWIGFEVDDLDSALQAAGRLKAKVMFTRKTPPVFRGVVLDPDGRAVELTQRA